MSSWRPNCICATNDTDVNGYLVVAVVVVLLLVVLVLVLVAVLDLSF